MVGLVHGPQSFYLATLFLDRQCRRGSTGHGAIDALLLGASQPAGRVDGGIHPAFTIAWAKGAKKQNTHS